MISFNTVPRRVSVWITKSSIGGRGRICMAVFDEGQEEVNQGGIPRDWEEIRIHLDADYYFDNCCRVAGFCDKQLRELGSLEQILNIQPIDPATQFVLLDRESVNVKNPEGFKDLLFGESKCLHPGEVIETLGDLTESGKAVKVCRVVGQSQNNGLVFTLDPQELLSAKYAYLQLVRLMAENRQVVIKAKEMALPVIEQKKGVFTEFLASH